MKLDPIRIVSTQIRPRLLWFLLLVGLLLALWEMPLANMVHRQTGMRGFLRAALQNEPPSAERGQAAISSSEVLDPVMSHLRQANTEPNTPRPALNTYRTLGVAELATDNPADAELWLQRRLEIAPTDVLARYFLGEAYRRQGDAQAAIEEWEAAGAHRQLIDLAEDFKERGEWAEALMALDAAMQLNAKDAESFWLAAEIWREQGNAERALALYQEVMALYPQNVESRQRAAEMWIELGDTERALALCREVIAMTPEEPVGYALSGIALFDEGQYEQAIGFFNQAVERYPDSHPWLLVMLGRAYAATGQWPEAIGAYERTIREDPTHHWDYVLMGDAQCQAEHPEEALAYYELAVALGNQDSQVQQVADYIVRNGDCPPGPQFH